MSGHQGSIALRLVNPVFRGVCQSAFRRYHDDLDGMRKFLDRAGAASGLLARPAPGCRIVDGELAGLSTREFHPLAHSPGAPCCTCTAVDSCVRAQPPTPDSSRGWRMTCRPGSSFRLTGWLRSTHFRRPSTIACAPMRHCSTPARSPVS